MNISKSWLRLKDEPLEEMASLRYRMAQQEGFQGSYSDFIDLEQYCTDFSGMDSQWKKIHMLRNGLGWGLQPKEVDISDKVLSVYFNKPADFHMKLFVELYRLQQSQVDYLDQQSVIRPFEFKCNYRFITMNMFLYKMDLLKMLHTLYCEAGDFKLWSIALAELTYAYANGFQEKLSNDAYCRLLASLYFKVFDILYYEYQGQLNQQ